MKSVLSTSLFLIQLDGFLLLGRPDWGGVKIFLCSKKIFEPM